MGNGVAFHQSQQKRKVDFLCYFINIFVWHKIIQSLYSLIVIALLLKERNNRGKRFERSCYRHDLVVQETLYSFTCRSGEVVVG